MTRYPDLSAITESFKNLSRLPDLSAMTESLKNMPRIPDLSAMAESLKNTPRIPDLSAVAESLKNMPRIPDLSAMAESLKNTPRIPDLSAVAESLKNMPRIPDLSAMAESLKNMPRIPDLSAVAESLKNMPRIPDLSAISQALKDFPRIPDIGEMTRNLNDALRHANASSCVSREVRDALRFLKIGSMSESLGEIVRTTVPEINKTVHKNISEADVQQAVATIETGEFGLLSAEQKIDYLYQHLKKEKDRPLVKIVLFFILLKLAEHVLADAWSFCKEYLTNHVNVSQFIRLLVKSSHVSHCGNMTESRDLRVVARFFSKIHASYKTGAPQMAILPLGSYVRLIRKRKKWSLVEWPDQWTGELVKGWIRSKYLKRLVK